MTASVKDVPENDKVLIKLGEKIPADGVIDDGQSSVNEAIVRTREGDLRSRATLLKTVLAKLYGCLDNPDFNPTVNAARRGDEDKGYFLWHTEIVPRLPRPSSALLALIAKLALGDALGEGHRLLMYPLAFAGWLALWESTVPICKP